MKNKLIKILTITLLVITLTIPFKALADSGFDTGYDGGGGGDSYSYGGYSSGDYSSNDDSSNNSYDTGEVTTETIIIATIIVVIIIIIIIYSSSTPNKNASNPQFKRHRKNTLTNEQIASIDPTLTVLDICERARTIYLDVQMAWMNNQQEVLQQYLTDELYNQYIMQLDSLEMKNEQNIMEDIQIHYCMPVSMKREDNLETIEVEMDVRMKDYIINKNTQQVLRGSKSSYVCISYTITLTRSINNNTLKACPSCGGQIKDQNINHCEYCGAEIIQNTNNLVMAKKENRGQW